MLCLDHHLVVAFGNWGGGREGWFLWHYQCRTHPPCIQEVLELRTISWNFKGSNQVGRVPTESRCLQRSDLTRGAGRAPREKSKQLANVMAKSPRAWGLSRWPMANTLHTDSVGLRIHTKTFCCNQPTIFIQRWTVDWGEGSHAPRKVLAVGESYWARVVLDFHCEYNKTAEQGRRKIDTQFRWPPPLITIEYSCLGGRHHNRQLLRCEHHQPNDDLGDPSVWKRVQQNGNWRTAKRRAKIRADFSHFHPPQKVKVSVKPDIAFDLELRKVWCDGSAKRTKLDDFAARHNPGFVPVSYFLSTLSFATDGRCRWVGTFGSVGDGC